MGFFNRHKNEPSDFDDAASYDPDGTPQHSSHTPSPTPDVTYLNQLKETRVILASNVDMMKGYRGHPDAEGLILRKGERVYLSVDGAARLGEKRGPGQWEGGSSGISVPLFKIGGQSVRGRIGQTKGHLIQGELQTVIADTGTLWFTSLRIIFQGTKTTSDVALGKVIAYDTDPVNNALTISVSGRAKPLTVWTNGTPEGAAALVMFLEMCVADINDNWEPLISKYQAELDTFDATYPQARP